jgi:hypothetical protein
MRPWNDAGTQYVGVDASPEYIDQARQRFRQARFI